MKKYKDVEVNNFNPVRKNERYVIPSYDKAFKLDDKKGKEKIYFVAHSKPDIRLEEAYARILNERQSADGVENKVKEIDSNFITKFKRRGIESIVTNHNIQLNWRYESEEQEFSVFEQRLDGLCTDCYYSIMFNHM
jgi:hypothetical protein